VVILALACVRSAEPQLFATVHPDQAFRHDIQGPPRDQGLLLVGAEVEALLQGLELSWEDDDLVDPDHAPTHEVRLQLGEWHVLYDAHPTAFGAAAPELAQRLGGLLTRPPTHYGHWVSVPASMSPSEALATLARAGHPGFLQPLRRRSPWVEVTWETHAAGEPGPVEDRLRVRREDFTGRLLREVPGATAFQASSGSEGARVYVSERYQLPFGVEMARVSALVEADGARLEQAHAPTHYLVSVWTGQPAPPSLPAPFAVAGPYFPLLD
jgi:hypothetical protein